MDLSRYTAQGDSPLHRLDGRVKTGLLLAAVVLSATLSHWQIALGLWICATGLFLTLRSGARELLGRLLIPLGIAWVVFLSVLFTTGSHALFVIPLRVFTLTAWQEGAMRGLLLFMRIMAAVTFATLLAFSTPMIEILETLRLWRVPDVVIDIADMMYRYVFIIQDTAHTMHRAQICRMGENAPWSRRVGDIGRLASSILIKSLDRSTRIYQAMLSRGYDESAVHMPFFAAPIRTRDRMLAGAAALAMLALVIINLRWS